jgi:hypothetical protein
MKIEQQQFDALVPDPQVRRELGGITIMTTWRWDNEVSTAPEGWGPPIKVGKRNFRTRSMLENVKANLTRAAAVASETRLAKRGAR